MAVRCSVFEGMMELKVLYQKTATGAIAWWKVWTEGAVVRTAWGQVDGKEQQQHYTAEPKNVGRANATTAEGQADFEADALWKKKKRLKYYETVEEAESNINIKPMLAQEYEKRKDQIVFPVTVQPKLDGYRCLGMRGDVLGLMSRGGKPYDMQHIINELTPVLPPGIMPDGELYVHGLDLQSISSLIKRPREESLAVKYHIYDATKGNEEIWSARAVYLDVLSAAFYGCTTVEIVPSYTATSHEQIKNFHDAFVGDGYEGAIIRTMDHTYRFGYRSPGLLKLKDFEEKEFQIVGHTKGKDNVPLWIVNNDEHDNTFEVRPKGTDAQRAEMLKTADQQKGKWLTTRFMGRTKAGKPKIATGIVIRERGEFK
jgi:ATP-dependent DNA ligase